MTAATISTHRARLYEARPCFAGEPNHVGVPILRLNEAGEPVTVALVSFQGEGSAAEVKAAATATAAVMAQAANLLELLEASWGSLKDGLTSGERIVAINRAISAAHTPSSPFQALHLSHVPDLASDAGEGARP